MKKIFAILISLLFVGSSFGIASVMADGCNCDGKDLIIPSHVQVGQIFDFQVTADCEGTETIVGGGNPFDYMEIIWEEESNGVRYGKVKALKQGTYVFCPSCSENYCVTLTIGPKQYPMDWFMKKFGLGKKN